MGLFGKKEKTKGTTKSRVVMPEMLEKNAFSGRAYARHSIAVLVLILLAQLGVIFFLIFNQYLTTSELNKKNFAVFRENCAGGIEVSNINSYQTTPDDVTVRSLAWNVVRLIKSAGSGNADVVLDEASRLMTGDMKQAFQIISDTEKANLTRATVNGEGVYRVLEKIQVKTLDKEDLPPGAKTEITQYDMVVNGTARILSMGSKREVGNPEEFSIRIRTVPLQARTEANPWGLLVSSMDILDPGKSLRRLKEIQANKEKQNSSGSTIGDALGLSPDKMQEDRNKIQNESDKK